MALINSNTFDVALYCIHIHIYIYACMYACMHLRIFVCVYVHKQKHKIPIQYKHKPKSIISKVHVNIYIKNKK